MPEDWKDERLVSTPVPDRRGRSRRREDLERDRLFERSMSRAYIAELATAYDRFFAAFDDAPLLAIDTNGLDFVRNSHDFQDIVARIRARLNIGDFQRQLL